MNDLKRAFRRLPRHPGFTAIAVRTLALDLGANTAAFNVVTGGCSGHCLVHNRESGDVFLPARRND